MSMYAVDFGFDFFNQRAKKQGQPEEAYAVAS